MMSFASEGIAAVAGRKTQPGPRDGTSSPVVRPFACSLWPWLLFPFYIVETPRPPPMALLVRGAYSTALLSCLFAHSIAGEA